MAKPALRYKGVWDRLKTTTPNSKKVASVALDVTVSDNEVTQAKQIKTLVRALQKEKYNDYEFRIKHSKATLTYGVQRPSTIDQRPSSGYVTLVISFYLEYPITLEDL